MSTLADRLRGVIQPTPAGRPAPAEPTPRARDRAAEALGGHWVEAGGDSYLVIDRCYAPGHRHGELAVSDAAPAGDAWSRLDLLATRPIGPIEGHEATRTDGVAREAGAPRQLFVDLETTGLAGGAGTYAFLVGCAWFDGDAFRVRQFFLASFTAERVLLQAVASLAASARGVVTYNGKSFDLPLLETRFSLHRMTTPFAVLPHVDMLHPARRLWRPEGTEAESEGCTLAVLERRLCGHARVGDVPGFEIPSRYFHYVRSGDAQPLEAVCEHNRLDLLSLAMFTARAARLLTDGARATTTAREATGAGRLFERGGMTADAVACYRRAVGMPGDAVTHAEALRAHAGLARRQRHYREAADLWRRLLGLDGCPPQFAREAAEALAVHHEHRERDLEGARRLALQSLRLPGPVSRRQATEHRLARLSRKLGMRDPSPLF